MPEAPPPMFIFGITSLKLFAKARGDSVPDEIIGVVPDNLRSIDFHALPLPSA
jgi:hypothetical protein